MNTLPPNPKGGLWPAEKMALKVAEAQIARGEDVTPNVAHVCAMALSRLAGDPPAFPQQRFIANVREHPDLQFDDVGGGPKPPDKVLVTLWASDDDGGTSPGEVAFGIDGRWGVPVHLEIAP